MACTPYSTASSSSRSSSVRPAARSSAASSTDQESGGDAVLVLHELRRHAVAERLLVAVAEPGDPADPLEAGQRLLVARGRAARPSPRGATTRRSTLASTPSGDPSSIRWSPSSAPTSSPLQHAPPSPVGTATAQRSASGSLAMTRSAARSRRRARWRGPSRPAPPGSGRRPSGSPGPVHAGSGRRWARRSPARRSASLHGLAADAVQRRVARLVSSRAVRRRAAR